MTVHMLRLYAEPPGQMPANALENAIAGMTNSPWTADPDPASGNLTESNTEMDGSGTRFVAGSYRYLIDSSEPHPLNEMQANLESVVEWYRIMYHVCDHDEDTGEGCSWNTDSPYDSGPVPSDIPHSNSN